MVSAAHSGALATPQTTAPPPASVLPAALRERVVRFHEERVRGTWGGQIITRGRTPGPDSVLLTSNDYLALAADPRIAKAMADCLADVGTGILASGVLLHGDHPQLRLEHALAVHLGMSAGILCQSGWDANLGLLQSIADRTTPVYIDLLAHMSLWQGARDAGAPVYGFRHNDPAHLRRKIAEHGPGVVCVDSVYSSNGSLCPLGEICDAAEENGCVLVVDESHSLGTHGAHGEGLTAQLGLAHRVHFQVASLSKTFAGRAGFVACGDPQFVDYFRFASYPAIFSSTLLPHDVAGLAAALDAVRADDWRRTRLREVSAHVRGEIGALGYDLQGSASQIVSLQTGPDLGGIQVRDLLEERGVFGSMFFAPAVPHNRTLVRFSLHSALTDDDVTRLVAACHDIRDTYATIWPKGLTA
ncbi:alpha-hydroxyketone-type quorum-sensing autoinducer synthase [Streptomyces sp. NPDC059002]|uniref:alpha-hydroxyketone-type quorum-sensing autoinducer synthase n=1 Tax=Streptomyces sp. NPDC059002 TaxID=3346690 RepID=UPI00367EF09C